MLSNLPQSEADVQPLTTLVSEAYLTIDKAVQKGTLHTNTGARKKARCAKWRRNVLIAAGLYVPAPDAPGYKRYTILKQKQEAAAAEASS